MKELKIVTNIQVYDYNELVEEDKILVDKAKAMTEKSYAPYSKFHVGAALLLSNGKIVGGSNPEHVPNAPLFFMPTQNIPTQNLKKWP